MTTPRNRHITITGANTTFAPQGWIAKAAPQKPRLSQTVVTPDEWDRIEALVHTLYTINNPMSAVPIVRNVANLDNAMRNLVSDASAASVELQAKRAQIADLHNIIEALKGKLKFADLLRQDAKEAANSKLLDGNVKPKPAMNGSNPWYARPTRRSNKPRG